MVRGAATLIVAALAKSSRKIYVQALLSFQTFVSVHLMDMTWFPANVRSLSLYITYMLNKGYAVSTITSNISALSFFHKLTGCHDCTNNFVIRKILLGAKKLHGTTDTRFPITLEILHKLMDSVSHVSSSSYEIHLFRAMFILMFHALLRIGEVTSSPNNIKFSQVSLSDNSLCITFLKFKHNVSSPMSLVIQPNGSNYCPISTMKRYIQRRGSSPGPLFCLPGVIPVSSFTFSSIFNTCLVWSNYHHLPIKPHSFRIGAATWAAANGYTENQIQAMGRWNSNAFKKYIRIKSFIVHP